MSTRPKAQLFSSELIYQTVNAIRYFNEQVGTFREKLRSELYRREAEKRIEVSDFYFIQRRWANCRANAEQEVYKPWFSYAYYALTDLQVSGADDVDPGNLKVDLDNLKKVMNIIDSFSDPKFHWEELIQCVRNHNGGAKRVVEAVNWINENKSDLADLAEAARENNHSALSKLNEHQRMLHHHLLQLYSSFPVREDLSNKLYKEFIRKEGSDAQPAKAFYVFPLKRELDAEHGLPKFKVWMLGTESDTRFVPIEQDYDAEKEENPEQKAIKFFNKRLAPIFNEGAYEFTADFDYRKSEIDHMLWLPLYDEYIDDKYYGFFRGWLLQIFTGRKEALLEDESKATNSRHKALNDYILNCLKLTSSTALEINRAMMREVLNRPTLEKSCAVDVLADNICLLGDWDEVDPKPYDPKETRAKSIEFVSEPQKDEVEPIKIDIDLDPTFLEYNSGTFVRLDEIDEKPQILHLGFGKDFRKPTAGSEYYSRLTNLIYLIYTRLKDAKWAELQAQKYERNRMSNSLAHGLKNSFSVVVNLLKDNVDPIKDLSPPITSLKRNLGERLDSILEQAIKKGKKPEHINLETVLGQNGLYEKQLNLFIDSSKRAELISEFARETFHRIEAIYDKVDVSSTNEDEFRRQSNETQPLNQVILKAFASSSIIAFTREQPKEWEQTNDRKNKTKYIEAYGKPPTRPVLVYNTVPYSLQIEDFEELVNSGEPFCNAVGAKLLHTSIDKYLKDRSMSHVQGIFTNSQCVQKPDILAYVLEEIFFNCMKYLTRDEQYSTVAIYLDIEESEYTSFKIRRRVEGDGDKTIYQIVEKMNEESLKRGGLASCNQYLSKYEFQAEGLQPLKIDPIWKDEKSFVQYNFNIKPAVFAEKEYY